MTRSTASSAHPGGARRVVIVTYLDIQTLDVIGPLEVFSVTTRLLQIDAHPDPGYEVEVVATEAGPVTSAAGLQLVAQRALREVIEPIDTLLVAGGLGAGQAGQDAELMSWLRETAPRARRCGAVCTGSLLLAEAGLLRGRRATTHWASCGYLEREFPEVRVESDAIYVRDGNVYTSAGVTAGMDLALALVEEDLGRDVALTTARWLVLFLKRPGGQSQFSAQLAAQHADREPVRDLQTWILDHPAADLSVEALAERVHMSPRNFARVFTREVGITPAKFVERARIEAARRRLEESGRGVEEVAVDCGFGSAETMRRAFLRTLRVSPSEYRSRFQTARASA